MGELVYLRGVSMLQLDRDKCTGCRMCLAVCPHSVLLMDNGHARITDLDACMECGACARNCPSQAISVQAGVGCAAAVINSALGRDGSSCCCVIDSSENHESEDCGTGHSTKWNCC